MISIGWVRLASMDRKKLGKRLKDMRAGRYTQKELADAAGVSYGVVQDLESGEGNPQIDKIEAIEGVLGLPLIQLFGERANLGKLLEFRERLGLDSDDEISVLFRKLDNRGKTAVLNLAKSLLGIPLVEIPPVKSND